jgi:hypothetical protein
LERDLDLVGTIAVEIRRCSHGAPTVTAEIALTAEGRLIASERTANNAAGRQLHNELPGSPVGRVATTSWRVNDRGVPPPIGVESSADARDAEALCRPCADDGGRRKQLADGRNQQSEKAAGRHQPDTLSRRGFEAVSARLRQCCGMPP